MNSSAHPAEIRASDALSDGIESDNHMRQPCRSQHQRSRDKKDINRGFSAIRIQIKP